MYLFWGLAVVFLVTGLWTYALIAIALIFPVLFGLVVISMVLHDEEEHINKKFGTQDDKDENNGK